MQHDMLLCMAFGNASDTSPYDQSIHKELPNSTAMHLADPKNDAQLAPDSDLLKIRECRMRAGVADDRGVHQNDLIAIQWQFVAQRCLQRLRLVEYTPKVIINSIQPLIGRSELVAADAVSWWLTAIASVCIIK